MYLDHTVCSACEAVQSNGLKVFVDNNGMEAGDYPFPVAIPSEYARALSADGMCGHCGAAGHLRLALRSIEALA